MIIYEVNLTIDNEIYAEFQLWLKQHINDMLKFPGFNQANLLKLEQDEFSDKQQLTIQYQLENRNDLEIYFTKFATQMREAGIQRFNNKFSVTRRIFEIIVTANLKTNR